MSISKIRIGVYGATGSGKTAFWRQLIAVNAVSIASKSKTARWLESTLGPDGHIAPSLVPADNLSITIGPATYLFDDGPGGRLGEAVDGLDTQRGRAEPGNVVAKQVAQSDAFLFFFDPIGRQAGSVQGHYQQELQRAKQLIDYVLESRQNRLLPILFLLTDTDDRTVDPDTAGMTRDWIEAVELHYRNSYERNLLGYYPDILTRKENLFQRISLFRPDRSDRLSAALETARTLVCQVARFRKRDHKRAAGLVFVSIFLLLLFFLTPILFYGSPAARNALLHVRRSVERLFNFVPASGSNDDESGLSGAVADPAVLSEDKFSWNEKTLSAINRTLFMTMRTLNRLEDENREQSDEYKLADGQWNRGLDVIRRSFNTETFDSTRRKLDRFALLLANLADSPGRIHSPLEKIQVEYWQAYRRMLVGEFREEIAIQYAAGTPPEQLVEELCRRLESAFREVSESKVRGNPASEELHQVNAKEALKQEIRRTFVTCRNFSDRYAVEIGILSADFRNVREDFSDYRHRLTFFGGKEKGEIPVELSASSMVSVGESGAFLPARANVTLSFALAHPLLLVYEVKEKSSEGTWKRRDQWEIRPHADQGLSLATLGVLFYIRHENEENTRFVSESEELRFELELRRPRNVPEFLWETVEPVR